MVFSNSNIILVGILETLEVPLVVIIIWGARNVRCPTKHNKEMCHLILKYPVSLNPL